MMIFLLFNICIFFFFLIAHELHCMTEDISNRKNVANFRLHNPSFNFKILDFIRPLTSSFED